MCLLPLPIIQFFWMDEPSNRFKEKTWRKMQFLLLLKFFTAILTHEREGNYS